MDAFFVSEKEKEQRLDKYLSHKFPDYSRSYFQFLIQEKLVLINGEVVKKRTLVQEGDEIEVEFALTPEISLEAENIPLKILYEDADIIAIDKPAGMVVHPAVGNWSGTFVNALLYHCKLEGEGLRPGIVHRLDKDTTGLLIAAKNEKAQQALVEAFASRKIQKEYLAICVGNPQNCTITGNIGRHPVRRKQMTVLETGGKEAKTVVQTVKSNSFFSYVHLFPETGRTHQLRVHLKSVGCPILGDPIYGTPSFNQKNGADRTLLHAYKLKLTHPISGEELLLEAPIPTDIQSFIAKI